MDLILTIGGTAPAPGPSALEITPEATSAVLERPLPGLPEAMRSAMGKKTPLAFLDRSVAGVRGRTVILNLPAHMRLRWRSRRWWALLGAALAYVRQEPVSLTLEEALASLSSSDDGEEDEPMQPPSTPPPLQAQANAPAVPSILRSSPNSCADALKSDDGCAAQAVLSCLNHRQRFAPLLDGGEQIHEGVGELLDAVHLQLRRDFFHRNA